MEEKKAMPDVLAWVEEHGGLDAVKKRLMPEGCEWPRYESGEPVRIGDVVSGVEVRSVVFRDDGILLSDCTSVPGWGTWRSYKEPIKRPAPNVLDADGAEIRVGNVIYRKSDGRMVKVAEAYEKTFIDSDGYVRPGDGFTHRAPVLAADGKPLEVGQTVYLPDGTPVHVTAIGDMKAGQETVFGKAGNDITDSEWQVVLLTHQRPVLDVDGKPLREGEHVYHVETGAELVVKELPKPGEYQAVVVFAPPASHLTSFDHDQLTHERPVADSWERLEEDADALVDAEINGEGSCNAANAYCNRRGLGEGTSFVLMAQDLVRRAKKMAGVSE